MTAAVDKARLPSASARLQIPGDGEDGAILRVHGMPALETDQVYQVWLQRDGDDRPEADLRAWARTATARGRSDDLRGADA